uniref:hypothetical protein n=1 Tax=Streptomyces TaxID=1883 RepID=UPI000A4EB6E1|nr:MULTISPECIES: hypothetical protein [Streptomyces]MDI5912382.1 hypothetical protein [Streptomyces sp. 12257]
MAAPLERAVSGDPDGDVSFLDHEKVYDGFADPPRLLGPTAVADIAQGLDAIDVGAPTWSNTWLRCGGSTGRPPIAVGVWSSGSADPAPAPGRAPRKAVTNRIRSA